MALRLKAHALPLARYPQHTGSPLELVKPDILAHKAFEPVLIIGRQRLKGLDIRLRVRGGGHVSQVYGEFTVLHAVTERAVG